MPGWPQSFNPPVLVFGVLGLHVCKLYAWLSHVVEDAIPETAHSPRVPQIPALSWETCTPEFPTAVPTYPGWCSPELGHLPIWVLQMQ